MKEQNTWHGSADYHIKVKGRLGPEWSDWLDKVMIESEGDVTVLTGRILDQAALHGLLIRIRDLGLPLISVQRVESGQNIDE